MVLIFYARRGIKYGGDVDFYGTKAQIRRGDFLWTTLYKRWLRVTKIKMEPGEIRLVRLTFPRR